MSKDEIFINLKRRQQELESLIKNFDTIPGNQRATISRVAVEGRSITNILQNLRSVVSHFDDWYTSKVVEMANDPLLKFFYQLRTETLKRGNDGIQGIRYKPHPNASIELNFDTGIIVVKYLYDGRKV